MEHITPITLEKLVKAGGLPGKIKDIAGLSPWIYEPIIYSANPVCEDYRIT